MMVSEDVDTVTTWTYNALMVELRKTEQDEDKLFQTEESSLAAHIEMYSKRLNGSEAKTAVGEAMKIMRGTSAMEGTPGFVQWTAIKESAASEESDAKKENIAALVLSDHNAPYPPIVGGKVKAGVTAGELRAALRNMGIFLKDDAILAGSYEDFAHGTLRNARMVAAVIGSEGAQPEPCSTRWLEQSFVRPLGSEPGRDSVAVVTEPHPESQLMSEAMAKRKQKRGKNPAAEDLHYLLDHTEPWKTSRGAEQLERCEMLAQWMISTGRQTGGTSLRDDATAFLAGELDFDQFEYILGEAQGKKEAVGAAEDTDEDDWLLQDDQDLEDAKRDALEGSTTHRGQQAEKRGINGLLKYAALGRSTAATKPAATSKKVRTALGRGFRVREKTSMVQKTLHESWGSRKGNLNRPRLRR